MRVSPFTVSTQTVETVVTGIWTWTSDTKVPVDPMEAESDSGNWTGATILRISTIKSDGGDMTSALTGVVAGQKIRFEDTTDPTTWASWEVTINAVLKASPGYTNYFDIAVLYLEGGLKLMQNNRPVLLTVTREVPPPPPEPPYNTAGPPFPANPTDKGRYGVSILDYFAAHVMTGLAMRADITVYDLKADGARDAYWIAATMVELRGQLEITPTPVPLADSVPKPPPPTEHPIPPTRKLHHLPHVAETQETTSS